MDHYSDLLESITSPASLAHKLRAAGLVSHGVADDVIQMKGVSNLENATKLLKDVSNVLRVLKRDPSKQRDKLHSFCDVLKSQRSPALSIIASGILDNTSQC